MKYFLPISLSAVKSLYLPLPLRSMTLDTITSFRVFPAELGKIPRMYFIWIENSGAHGINFSEHYIPKTLHVPCFLHVIIMLDDFV